MITDSSNIEISKIGLIAGEGQLPVYVAENAIKKGIQVVPFSVARNNRKTLKNLCDGLIHCFDEPGLLDKNLATLRSEGIENLVFAGKVDKWILLRNPRLDKRAIDALAEVSKLSDDGLMLYLINGLKEEGFRVLSQTDFLQNLLLPSQNLSKTEPSQQQWQSIAYGFEMAKEMGRLDVGQTIVVKDRMIIAVEAIEGTDKCLERAGKLIKGGGGVVVKVAKPDQDQRFDVPTVGVRTLKTMKKAGLNCLVTEADETLFLEPELMTQYADKHGMCIVSLSQSEIQQKVSSIELGDD